MSHDVFISYSSQDKTQADAACAVLERNGIRCWIAPRDIVPGQDWSEEIVKAIKKASAFVLVFSAHANESTQVKREVELAVNRGIPVVPLRIEDVRPSESLEYFISTQHWMDAMTPPLEQHLERLARSIHTLIDDDAAPSSPPRRRSTPPPQPAAPTPSVTTTQPPQPGKKRLVTLAAVAGALGLIAALVGLLGREPRDERVRSEPVPQPVDVPAAPTQAPTVPTSTVVEVPERPTPACALKPWDRVRRNIVRGKWPPAGRPSGVFLQTASFVHHGDDMLQVEAAVREGVTRIWNRYQATAGADCQGAQMMLYDSISQPGWVGVGLLFECTGSCTIEPGVRSAIVALDEEGAFGIPHMPLDKVYFERLPSRE